MKRPLVSVPTICTAILIAAAFFAVVWLMSPFAVLLLVVPWLCLVGVSVASAGVLSLIFSRRERVRQRAKMLLSGAAVFASFWGLAILVNHIVWEQAVKTAMSYPARMEPLLEKFRQEHGAYPASLDQIPSRPPSPRLYDERCYQAAGVSYEFKFPKPDTLLDSWVYDSTSRTWQLLD